MPGKVEATEFLDESVLPDNKYAYKVCGEGYFSEENVVEIQ